MKIIAIVAITLFAATVASAQGNTVSYTYCSSRTCADGCSSQNFQSGECLRVNGQQSASVRLSCSGQAAMCSRAQLFNDPSCQSARVSQDSVCNACYFTAGHYTIAAGALFGATFWVTNCSDTQCGVCNAPTILGYNKCKELSGLAEVTFGKVAAPVPCTSISYELFNTSNSCQGTAVGTLSYWNDATRCNEGFMFSCSNSSSNHDGKLRSIRKPGGQRSITLPTHMLKVL